MIGILDYGIGNLRSVQKSFEVQGIAARLVRDPADVAGVERLVLPGQGAFGDCRRALAHSGFEGPLLDWIAAGRPVLGICVGMQLLFERSHEFGTTAGLSIFPGDVRSFADVLTDEYKIPQMGWNQVCAARDSVLWEGLDRCEFFYLVHSYYCAPAVGTDVLAVCEYGVEYAACVQRDRLYAVQFHPEKSADAGLRMLRNFAEKG